LKKKLKLYISVPKNGIEVAKTQPFSFISLAPEELNGQNHVPATLIFGNNSGPIK